MLSHKLACNFKFLNFSQMLVFPLQTPICLRIMGTKLNSTEYKIQQGSLCTIFPDIKLVLFACDIVWQIKEGELCRADECYYKTLIQLYARNNRGRL